MPPQSDPRPASPEPSDEERPVVIVTEGSTPTSLQWLRERAEVIEAAPGTPAFNAALPRTVGLVVRTYTRVDDELLARAPRLRVVGRGGVGLENIDIPACRARGVEVVFTPAANTQAVAEFVTALIIRLVRPFCEFHERTYPPQIFKELRETRKGHQLSEVTLGVLGMGNVGRAVSRIVTRGFGMPVLYHDIVDVSSQVDVPAASVSLDELLERADVLSVHIDSRASNHHFVNAGLLSKLRPNAVVINTSRGEVLDAAALAEALRGGRLRGAAIDVYDPEPPPPDFPLLGLENVILTPHMAARTGTALENMSWVVRDVIRVLSGERPQCPAPAG